MASQSASCTTDGCFPEPTTSLPAFRYAIFVSHACKGPRLFRHSDIDCVPCHHLAWIIAMLERDRGHSTRPCVSRTLAWK